MNCQKLLKDNFKEKESLTLINHTNMYESKDYNGMSNEKFMIKSLKFDLQSNPIPIPKLFNYYYQKNRENILIKEYNSVTNEKLCDCEIGKLPINRKKNHYFEFLPYDMNRVVLRKFPNEDDFVESEKFNSSTLSKDQLEYIHLKPTCYINASYINVLDNAGDSIQRKYIITQAPLTNTINDFWKMVWQTQCNQIVMLTNIVENGKIQCEKYWPNLKEIKNYGHLTCTCIKEIIHDDYTKRIIRLELKNFIGNDVIENNNYIDIKSKTNIREVTQYHFSRWKDHCMDKFSAGFALLLNNVRSHWSYREKINFFSVDNQLNKSNDEFRLKFLGQQTSPIIVHCSDGVGRSLVYILIDSLLEQAMKARDESSNFEDLKIDVLKQFANIRKQRMFGIKNVCQYTFVYQVLTEILCDEYVIDVESKDYMDYYKILKQPSIKSVNLMNISKLEEQFYTYKKFGTQSDNKYESDCLFNLKKKCDKQPISTELNAL